MKLSFLKTLFLILFLLLTSSIASFAVSPEEYLKDPGRLLIDIVSDYRKLNFEKPKEIRKKAPKTDLAFQPYVQLLLGRERFPELFYWDDTFAISDILEGHIIRTLALASSYVLAKQDLVKLYTPLEDEAKTKNFHEYDLRLKRKASKQAFKVIQDRFNFGEEFTLFKPQARQLLFLTYPETFEMEMNHFIDTPFLFIANSYLFAKQFNILETFFNSPGFTTEGCLFKKMNQFKKLSKALLRDVSQLALTEDQKAEVENFRQTIELGSK